MDLIWVGGLSRWETLGLFPRIYWGGHLGHPKVHRSLVRRLVIDGAGPVSFETDGELGEGLLPIEIEVVPRGLSIVRPHPG
jgi:diacylglycerol kinase (ATP)